MTDLPSAARLADIRVMLADGTVQRTYLRNHDRAIAWELLAALDAVTADAAADKARIDWLANRALCIGNADDQDDGPERWSLWFDVTDTPHDFREALDVAQRSEPTPTDEELGRGVQEFHARLRAAATPGFSGRRPPDTFSP